MNDGTERRDPLPPRGLRRVERCLIGLSIVILGACALAYIYAGMHQRLLGRRFAEILRAAIHDVGAARAAARETGVIGRLEIARAGISAIVEEGTDEHVLLRAVGHVHGTSYPGESGNVVLSAHRDTFFRRLGKIRPDERIRITTPDGVFEYRVESTSVVKPGRTDLLGPTREPTLTLITCYPFRYIGRAPERFVVRARQVGGA